MGTAFEWFDRSTVSCLLADAVATQQLGIHLGEGLPVGSVVLLQGNLGSGKTTLVQGIGAGLGIEEAIDSPTFTLINEYTDGRLPLYHLDLYRLSASEASALYPEVYWEGIEFEPGIVAIEWAERLPYRPGTYLSIQLTDAPPEGRRAVLQSLGEGAIDLSQLFPPA